MQIFDKKDPFLTDSNTDNFMLQLKKQEIQAKAPRPYAVDMQDYRQAWRVARLKSRSSKMDSKIEEIMLSHKEMLRKQYNTRDEYLLKLKLQTVMEREFGRKFCQGASVSAVEKYILSHQRSK